MSKFKRCPLIFDDMGQKIRLRAIDSLHSLGRHHNIKIIYACHTVTDLSVKSRKKTPVVYLTINSSLLSFTRFKDKFNLDSN